MADVEVMDVSSDVEHVMGQILDGVEVGTFESIENVSSTSSSEMDNLNTSDFTDVGKIESSSVLVVVGKATIKDKELPVLIELDSEDEEMDCSKENIEAAPAKSITRLVKNPKQDTESLAKIKFAITSLPRSELEEMYFKKIVELVNSSKQMTVLQNKLVSMAQYEERISTKALLLEKQVHDLSKAMKNVTENISRNPNFAQRAFTPIKFFRGVGVQARMEPLASRHKTLTPLGNSKTLNTPPVLPPVVAVSATATVKAKIMNGTTPPPQQNGILPISILGQGQKRVSKPTISVSELRNQVQPEPTPPANKVARRAGPASARLGGIPAKTQNQQLPSSTTATLIGTDTTITMTNGASVMKTGLTPTSNGIIDLTGETNTKPSGTGGIVINQNGLSYRVGVLNSSSIGMPMAQGVQLMTSTAGGYQLVHTASQGQSSRPVVFSSSLVRGSTPGPAILNRTPSPRGQNILIRTPNTGVRPRASLQNLPRSTGHTPSATRQTSPLRMTSTTVNNGQIIVSRQAVNSIITKAHAAVLSKFVLPEFPSGTAQIEKPKAPPPRPTLTVQEHGGGSGIVLSWVHVINSSYAEIQTYQLFACQEALANTNSNKIIQQQSSWKKVGEVKALPLPMACTLSQFTDENRYHFIVRGVDVYNRTGPFCEVSSIILTKKVK